MVTVSLNSDWKKITGKNLTPQDQLTSKIKEAVVCVTIGAMCDNYPMCSAGYTVDLSLCGRINTVIMAEAENIRVGCCCCTLLVSQYVSASGGAATTGKIHLFESPAKCVCTCTVGAAPFSELPDCATDAAGKSFKVRVIGY